MRNLILIASAAVTLSLFTLTACVAEDYATPAEIEQIETLEAAGDTEGAALVERGIAERTVGNIVAMVDPWIPLPVKVFAPLFATLFFKRVRRQAVKTLKEAGDVLTKTVTGDFTQAGQALGDMVDTALSVVGLKDSRKDTVEEMMEQVAALDAAGDSEGATALAAQAEAMKAKA